MILYADDTIIIITGSNKWDFNENSKQAFQDINAWFINNRLTLNLNKTQFLEFRTNHHSNDIIQSAYDIKGITNATEARFLGLILDNTLSWKKHIEQVVSKMCSACYALQNIKSSHARYIKNDIFCPYTLLIKLWYNSLGQLLICQKNVYNPKKEH